MLWGIEGYWCYWHGGKGYSGVGLHVCRERTSDAPEFRHPSFDYLEYDADGKPVHSRGVTAHPGLYFLGLKWLYRATSSLLGGVGRDAEHIVDHIVSTRLSNKDAAAARATTAGRQYA